MKLFFQNTEILGMTWSSTWFMKAKAKVEKRSLLLLEFCSRLVDPILFSARSAI